MEQILESVEDDSSQETIANLCYTNAGKFNRGSDGLVALSDHLDFCLIKYKAKPYGLCPVRRRLFDQCFELIIRQVSHDCAQRAKLLEAFQLYVKETIVTYDNMYRSALHFALRKATRDIVEAEMSHADLTQQISNKKSLEEKLDKAKLKLEQLSENYKSKKVQLEEDHSTKMTKLRLSNLYLRKQFETLVVPISSQFETPLKSDKT